MRHEGIDKSGALVDPGGLSTHSITLALAALLVMTSVLLGTSPVGAQQAASAKPPWQLPPVSPYYHPAEHVRYVPKAPPGVAAPERSVASIPQPDSPAQRDLRPLAFPVRPASYDSQASKDAPSKEAPTAPPVKLAPVPVPEPPGKTALAEPKGVVAQSDLAMVGEPADCDGCDACDESCACQYCDPCFSCLRPLHDRLWLNAEYAVWWTKGGDIPALVAGSVDGRTNILFGNERLNEEGRSGVRFALGYWLDPCESAAVEATYFLFGEDKAVFQASSPDTPILSRPYFNIQTGTPTARLLASPTTGSGSVSVDATSYFYGMDLLYRHNLRRDCDFRADGLVGYRFLTLDEQLTIHDSTRTLGTETPTTTQATDVFRALSQFHGGELGVAGQWRRCRWSLDVLMKMALGITTTRLRIDGSTLSSQSPQPRTGGLLAQPTNIQWYRQGQFAVVPELGVTLGYDLTCRLRATLGYTLLYWSNVARPGDQIDLDVNPSQFTGQLVGAPKPEFRFTATDFWAQGLSLGLDYRF